MSRNFIITRIINIKVERIGERIMLKNKVGRINLN
jgi:hypothetical protein